MSKVLWRWREACAAVGAEPVDGPDIFGVSIDSRSIAPGDLFVALLGDPGPRFNTDSRSDRDGHAFVAAAAAGGAVGALVHREAGSNLPVIRVADTLDGLWNLARARRGDLSCPVFAVTGSAGKTTAKAWLCAALGGKAGPGSLNNFWGVPLTLARTAADTDVAVFELGTNHPGEIAPLAELVEPTVALVLNVLPAHLAFFPDMDALTREKLSIADGLTPKGTLVMPDTLAPPPNARHCLFFGRSPAADVQLLAFDESSRMATIRAGELTVEAPVPGGGEHRALTLTGVAGCLHAAGLDAGRIAGLDDTLVPAGRGQVRVVSGIDVVDDCYNANPVSMRAALEALVSAPAKRRFAIIGEMLELGEASDDYHRSLAEACRGIDGIFCVGPGARVLFDVLPQGQRMGYADRVEDIVLTELTSRFGDGDRVLVKGSNRVFWTKRFVEMLVDALSS